MYPILDSNNKVVGKSSSIPPMYTGQELPDDLDITEKEDSSVFYKEGEFIRVGTFDLAIYKAQKLSLISVLCYQEMEKMLPSSKQMNILLGATLGYPSYLVGDKGKENLAKLIEVYKKIYHDAETLIKDKDCDLKRKVDTVLSNIVFPTEADVKSMVIGG